MKPKNTICLWFEKDALEAARFSPLHVRAVKSPRSTRRPPTTRAARPAKS